jgi:hypothetical protein
MALATVVRILAMVTLLAALPVPIVIGLWGGDFGLLLACEVIISPIVLISAAHELRGLGNRLSAPDAASLLTSDPDPPVFYLRPFGIEHALFLTGMRPKTFEEFLANEIEDRVGPFVALDE